MPTNQTYQITLYIPEPYGKGKTWVDRALSEFSAYFGGATSYLASGAWSDGLGNLVREPIAAVSSFEMVPGQIDKYGELIYKLAAEIKEALVQDSVAMSIISGVIRFV